MNHSELLKKVNPVYFSAKGCIGLLAETKEPDIMRFYNDIDKETITAANTDMNTPLIKSWVISMEVRYITWNTIAKETDCQNIVDLPCGYLPHCLKVAKLNKKYYGIDLPVVIEEISPIAFKNLSAAEKNLVQYHAADATNYLSLRNALKDVQGEICIITDGLLGYFNRYDLKSVCKNIHRLLREFGGCWYTSDYQFTDLMATTHVLLTGGKKSDMLEANKSGSGKIADADTGKFIFNTGTLEERKNFIEECGFNVKTFRYSDMINFIPSLKDNPALMQQILSTYQDFEGWILTAEETTETQETEIPFAQNFSVKDNVLSISISGRLDSITAPELLQKYEEQRAKNIFEEIHVDAAKLSYISYAGLRVFKIMQESYNLFKINNMNDEVRKIFEESQAKN